jgi:hypothetical protein
MHYKMKVPNKASMGWRDDRDSEGEQQNMGVEEKV